MRFNYVFLPALSLTSSEFSISLDTKASDNLTERSYRSRNRDLEKRHSIDETLAIITTGLAGIGAETALANYISTQIKTLSDPNSCSTISGFVNNVNYQHHAQTTSLKCDTTVELKTIQDARNRAISYMNDNNIKQACFDLTHGGTWSGLLQLTAADSPIVNGRCDSITYSITI